MELSPLQNFKKENFYLKPYPHIIIENALPNKLYDDLCDKFPKISENKLLIENTIFTLLSDDIIKDDEIDNSWKNFIKEYSSQNFYNKALEIFGKSILGVYKNYFKTIDDLKNLTIANSPEDQKKKNSDLYLNGNIMFYTEVKKDGLPKKDNEEKLKVHSDGPNKFLTSLMYFKNKSDKSENMGGDLAIHHWRFPLPFFLKKIILAKNNNFINSIIRNFQFIFIGLTKTITYEPNKFVMFLGSIDSLHSVTSRKKGSPIRRNVHSGVHYRTDFWSSRSLIDKVTNIENYKFFLKRLIKK